MYPGQTSLIPVQVALARFFEAQGWRVLSLKYPYWYLGTTPYYYLTGPVLPALLVILKKLLQNYNYFDLLLGLIFCAWVFGAIGVYYLTKAFEEKTAVEKNCFIPFLAAFFYFFCPLAMLIFPFSNGLSFIAFSFFPWFLVSYIKYIRYTKLKNEILLCLLICFIILIDAMIIPAIMLGMAAVLFSFFDLNNVVVKIKKSLSIFLFALILATFWYTPGYWFRLLLAPSFSGKPAIVVIGRLGQLLPLVLGIVMAIISVKAAGFKHKKPLKRFVFFWLFVFGFLTGIRFMADPDFWLDWSAWTLEIQLGTAVLGAIILNRFKNRLVLQKKRIKAYINLFFIMAFYCLGSIFVFNKLVLKTFRKNITDTMEYWISSQLNEIAKKEEVIFISGAPVFWLNAFYDLTQVRGGVDQTSVDPDWRKVAWEIREGEEVSKTEDWLKKFNIKYLVVHSDDSEEYYHDFKYPDKFENSDRLEKIYEQDGDRIYRFDPAR